MKLVKKLIRWISRKKADVKPLEGESIIYPRLVEPEIKPQDPVIQMPKYEGVQVIKIIRENINGMWHRCRMEDETIRDIPIELFSNFDG